MLNKRHLHHTWRTLRPINHWYFFAVFVVLLITGVFALRQNNLTAIELRDKVLEVDKQDGDVEAALKELREFVHSHMNASLSTGTNVQQPIQLKYRYERLVKAEKKRVDKLNEQIYTKAQNYCESKLSGSFYGGPRVPCIQDYVTSHGAKENPIPDSLYKFDFISPRWSPDLAGWSLLLATVFLLLFIFRFGLERWIRHELE